MENLQTNSNDIKKQIEDNTHRWYSLSVVSGQEMLVVENLRERIKKQNLGADIVDFLVPMVNEATVVKGKKVIKPRKIYPGYIFIKTRMNDKLWYVIRNTPGVKLIVGAETRPIPLTDKEHENIMAQIDKSNEKAEVFVPFQKGDVVMLKEGDFEGMKGNVKDVDAEKGIVVVNIEILGRLTPIAVAFDKVSAVD
ncbi:transcription termination/antitermination factor NusG [Patescibacteria group bacterium]|nr:transcription termination/antitermination factor NusG [Patescibacteria group bacterium]